MSVDNDVQLLVQRCQDNQRDAASARAALKKLERRATSSSVGALVTWLEDAQRLNVENTLIRSPALAWSQTGHDTPGVRCLARISRAPLRDEVPRAHRPRLTLPSGRVLVVGEE